jgi:hypothetical protein
MAARYLLPSGAFGHERKFSEDLIKKKFENSFRVNKAVRDLYA